MSLGENTLVNRWPRTLVVGLACLATGGAGAAHAQAWDAFRRLADREDHELAHQPAEPAPSAAAAPVPGAANRTDPAPASSPVALALSQLLDAGATEAERLEGGRVLAGMAGTDEGRMAIVGVLRSTAEEPSARWLLVRALAREAALPASLLPALTELAPHAEGDRVGRVLSAIGAIRTPEALRVIVRYLDPTLAEPTRVAAVAALVRATGRDDLGTTVEAWNHWIDRATASGDTDPAGSGWLGSIVRGLSERGERQAARARDLSVRLADSQRRLYVTSQEPQRPALLAAMLRDDVPEVRTLGFELVERELVLAPTPSGEVVAAIVDLLKSPVPGVRAQAAGLVGRIAPEGAGDAVAAALSVERDGVAAAALLRAASRWPSPAMRDPVLRWLQNGPGMRPVAAEAALAMQRTGQWTTDDLELVREAMRQVPGPDLSAAGCRLIAGIGSPEDLQRLSELLLSGIPVQRSAVADSLTGRPEFVDAILAAANRDATLILAAARTVAACRPTLEGFRAVAQLTSPEVAVRRTALQTVGETLKAGALLSAADDTGGDIPTIAWLLERALSLSQQAVAAGEPGAADLLRESAERLARQRLELGRPADAIAALDAAPEGSPTSRLRTLRIVALIVLGRVEDARALRGGPEAWLDGLERCVGMEQAAEVVKAIRADMVGQFDAAQTARFEALVSRVQASAEVPPGRG